MADEHDNQAEQAQAEPAQAEAGTLDNDRKEAIKQRLIEVIQEFVPADAKFTSLDTKEASTNISATCFQLLKEAPELEGHKLFVKAAILQVNGYAISSNTLWSPEDHNLSVSWTNNVGCTVWLTAVVNPNPPVLIQ
eukprot:TRINITY_DN2466_c0_g1_i1.p2 TRINITY_DN2466_c0_g1~~TRINITY_DN2466_c0_g1_i1.p2  ORF type:complete len:136 (-),score=48.28 TRINITY_DN2466_c0_g1_i1:288-695(-)